MSSQTRIISLVAAAQVRWSLPILSVAAALAILAGIRVVSAAEPAPTATAVTSSVSDSMQIEEVTVVGHKLDQHKLATVIIPRFVQSHGAPSPKSHQIGRWTRPAFICVRTVGLKPPAADYLSHRIMTVAAYVGAPTAKNGRCKPSVEIIFTPDPQAQITHFGQTYPAILGYDGKSRQHLLTVRYPIQAWYTTATYTFAGGWTIDTDQPSLGPPYLVNIEELGRSSRLNVGMVSGFGNILVVADAKQVSEHSFTSIADYITMLVLTRTSIDGCSELPSIMDLLSADCAGRAPPNFITGADVAYLKALYSTNLEMNLNLERGEMRDSMLKGVLGR